VITWSGVKIPLPVMAGVYMMNPFLQTTDKAQNKQ
jgi:hypothetical protein